MPAIKVACYWAEIYLQKAQKNWGQDKEGGHGLFK